MKYSVLVCELNLFGTIKDHLFYMQKKKVKNEIYGLKFRFVNVPFSYSLKQKKKMLTDFKELTKLTRAFIHCILFNGGAKESVICYTKGTRWILKKERTKEMEKMRKKDKAHTCAG